jgi:hypothetical protein
MLGAQQPAPPPPSPAQTSIAAYRAPEIALVQPTGGATVPQDKPIVVFRFAQGEPTDPLDARSFAVAVDGEDRTALFQVAAGEAWGPLAARGGENPIALGAHQITARICSARGTCTVASAMVTVVPEQAAAPPGDGARAGARNKRNRLIEALLAATRRLLQP